MITHFGWKMFSSSRSIASGFGLALAFSFAIPGKPLAAQATPQDTAHKGMKMPTNMPMGADSTHHEMGGIKSMADTVMRGMKHHSAEDMMIGPVGVSMERMGSGTTWVPDADGTRFRLRSIR